jgi:hypothetical protein
MMFGTYFSHRRSVDYTCWPANSEGTGLKSRS